MIKNVYFFGVFDNGFACFPPSSAYDKYYASNNYNWRFTAIRNNNTVVYTYIKDGLLASTGRPGSLFGISIEFQGEYISDLQDILTSFRKIIDVMVFQEDNYLLGYIGNKMALRQPSISREVENYFRNWENQIKKSLQQKQFVKISEKPLFAQQMVFPSHGQELKNIHQITDAFLHSGNILIAEDSINVHELMQRINELQKQINELNQRLKFSDDNLHNVTNEYKEKSTTWKQEKADLLQEKQRLEDELNRIIIEERVPHPPTPILKPTTTLDKFFAVTRQYYVIIILILFIFIVILFFLGGDNSSDEKITKLKRENGSLDSIVDKQKKDIEKAQRRVKNLVADSSKQALEIEKYQKLSKRKGGIAPINSSDKPNKEQESKKEDTNSERWKQLGFIWAGDSTVVMKSGYTVSQLITDYNKNYKWAGVSLIKARIKELNKDIPDLDKIEEGKEIKVPILKKK